MLLEGKLLKTNQTRTNNALRHSNQEGDTHARYSSRRDGEEEFTRRIHESMQYNTILQYNTIQETQHTLKLPTRKPSNGWGWLIVAATCAISAASTGAVLSRCVILAIPHLDTEVELRCRFVYYTFVWLLTSLFDLVRFASV